MFRSHVRTAMLAFSSGILGAMMLSSAALAWDGWLEGDPDQFGQGATGYFIWHDDGAWRLRTHNDPSGATYSGRIHTDGTFQNVHLMRDESTEHLSVADGGHTIRFRFKTYDHVDGLNFRIEGGSHVRFDLETNGRQTLLRHIFLGDAGRHPHGNPFRLER